MTWPLFSPPSIAPVDLHPLEDVLVADGRPDELPAGGFDGGLQAAVRQDGDDDAAGQARPGEPVEGQDAEHLVAVDDLAVASTAISRSASPSSANPTSAPRATTASASDAGRWRRSRR
jgi:hypothetical protein